MLAFMSYQTEDKLIAARVTELLATIGCNAFMAHEHIQVSEEWRLKILQQLEAADLFVSVLSQNYYNSIFCKQESGIAAFRNMTVIPLSIDGSIPMGFISHIQSTKIDPAAPKLTDLLPGLAKHDVKFVIDVLISIIAKSGNYRSAESNFALILPYIAKATDEQVVNLLHISAKNAQIYDASLCARSYLPPLLQSHGRWLDPVLHKHLTDVIKRYAIQPPPPPQPIRGW